MAILTPPRIISSATDLAVFLSPISRIKTLYLDLEGKNLGRGGTLTIMTVLVNPERKASIIDIQALGKSAFTTCGTNGRSLKAIIEDPDICKCLWDTRNDADALWSLYGVRLAGVTDIQLLENASRVGPKAYVSGLENCIKRDLGLKPAELLRWTETKKDVKALMSDNVFSRRPIDEKIARYCANDVVHLPALRSLYTKRLDGQWLQKVMDESKRRVATACSPSYEPRSEKKKFGPWASKADKRKADQRSLRDQLEEWRERAIE